MGPTITWVASALLLIAGGALGLAFRLEARLVSVERDLAIMVRLVEILLRTHRLKGENDGSETNL